MISSQAAFPVSRGSHVWRGSFWAAATGLRFRAGMSLEGEADKGSGSHAASGNRARGQGVGWGGGWGATSCSCTLDCRAARLPRPMSWARVTLDSPASSPSLSCTRAYGPPTSPGEQSWRSMLDFSLRFKNLSHHSFPFLHCAVFRIRPFASIGWPRSPRCFLGPPVLCIEFLEPRQPEIVMLHRQGFPAEPGAQRVRCGVVAPVFLTAIPKC